MNAEELSNIIAKLRFQGTDDAFVEAKACSQGLSKTIWESVSAFANTHGGTLLLGIDEERGFVPAKGFDFDRVRDQFVSGIGDGGEENRAIENPPSFELSRIAFEGAQVLVVELSEADIDRKPCYVKRRQLLNGSFKRLDDKDIKLSPTEIYALQNLLKPSRADRLTVEGSSLEDLDEQLISRLISRKQKQGSKALRGVADQEKQLERLGVLSSSGEAKLAGLLSVGLYPQQFYPKLVLDVAVHPGTEKSVPGQPRFLDRVICEGPIGEMIQDAVSAITRNLRTYSMVEGTGRKDVSEIPEEVLREAVANALIHREYSEWFLGQSVSVDIFPDRVEILNPGGLWGGKTLDNIGDGTSRCRNDFLMSLLESVPLPGGDGFPAEGEGSGISYMIREMKSRALRPPQFEADIDSFKVIFGRSGTEILENRSWIQGISDKDLDKHQEAILLYVRRNGSASIRELRDEVGIDSDDIRELVKELVTEGYLEEHSNRYRLLTANGTAEKGYSGVLKKILMALSEDSAKGARDIATEINETVSLVRHYLPLLIREGEVVATAPTNSPKRKYLLNKR